MHSGMSQETGESQEEMNPQMQSTCEKCEVAIVNTGCGIWSYVHISSKSDVQDVSKSVMIYRYTTPRPNPHQQRSDGCYGAMVQNSEDCRPNINVFGIVSVHLGQNSNTRVEIEE